MPDKVMYVAADNGQDLMAHLKQVLGEDAVNNDLKITQESVDQKIIEWNQKTTPETNSSIDFFKEQSLEIFMVNVKNFDSKAKVMHYVGEKIQFNFDDLQSEEIDQMHESQVSEENLKQGESMNDMGKKET
jgi:hypothetical protein